MITIAAVILLAMFAAEIHAGLIEDAAKECAYCDDWNKPQPPFKVHGNTWYVGTQDLSAILSAAALASRASWS